MKQSKRSATREKTGAWKKERRKRAAKALVAAGAIAGGTQAYASPVRFDNPPHGDAGHFHWPPSVGGNQTLDLTAEAGAQPGALGGPTNLTQQVAETNGTVRNANNAPIEVQVTGYFLEGVDAGVVIPSGFSWLNFGITAAPDYGPSLLPEGVATYLGARFDPNGSPGAYCTPGVNCQYAWVGVVRSGNEVEAFAWGYETDPAVPIAAGAQGGGGDPVCGDGVVEGDEECDDGGESATCDADCTFAECGDGTINATAGEECDPPDGVTCDDNCLLIGEPVPLPIAVPLGLGLLAAGSWIIKKRQRPDGGSDRHAA